MKFIKLPEMGSEMQNGEILSTWKEIAAYLKTSVRSCLRWEKESGLPVHRQEGAPRSRVFAYKNELDEWFKSRLGNGTILAEAPRPWLSTLRRPYILIPLAALIVGTALFVGYRNSKRPAGNAPASGVPQSYSPLEIRPGDFVETEAAASGKLGIWRTKGQGAYFQTWRIEPVRHSTFALGNLDDDTYIEIAAPGHCRETDTSGPVATTKIRFFINAYKFGFKDWWKTTYFDPNQCIFEKENFEFTETVIGDVDGVPGNEIVLATAHGLSVFKYDPQRDELRLVSTRNSFIENANVLLRSVVVTDLDGDGHNEILASANEGEEGAEAPDKGWLLLFRWVNGRPEISQTIMLPGATSVRGLKVGDVIPGGTKEVVVPYYKNVNEVRNAYLLGWAMDRGFVFDQFIDEVGQGKYGGIYPAVGDLSPKPGDEILVGRNNPSEVLSLFWQESALGRGPKFPVEQGARITNVQIGEPRAAGAYSSVLISGISETERQTNKLFLQLVNFGNGFYPGWTLSGGEIENIRGSYAAFVDKRNQ